MSGHFVELRFQFQANTIYHRPFNVPAVDLLVDAVDVTVEVLVAELDVIPDVNVLIVLVVELVGIPEVREDLVDVVVVPVGSVQGSSAMDYC